MLPLKPRYRNYLSISTLLTPSLEVNWYKNPGTVKETNCIKMKHLRNAAMMIEPVRDVFRNQHEADPR